MSEINKATLELMNKLCSKSKKHCAICDKKLGRPTKEELNDFKGRAWCCYITYLHPVYKSKKYKLCGRCSSVINKL